MMYYVKLPAGTNFTLTAKATVNSLAKNNQVSFGLMARDEMYVDTSISDPIGDYVAVAPGIRVRSTASAARAVSCTTARLRLSSTVQATPLT